MSGRVVITQIVNRVTVRQDARRVVVYPPVKHLVRVAARGPQGPAGTVIAGAGISVAAGVVSLDIGALPAAP